MPQIFHPAFNTISRVSIFGGVFLLAAAGLVAGVLVRSPYATEVGIVRVQPVPFSHQHHVGDVGIDCRYCHRTVETAAYAGMPSSELCLDCHSQLWAKSPMLAPVRNSVDTGEPLRWSRVHDVPDYAYFHHAIHVNKGIACETCHGDVDQMPLMYRAETLHMEWCLNCHRNPEKYVRPRSAVTEMNWQPARDSAGTAVPSGAELVEQYHIQSRTNCSYCHR